MFKWFKKRIETSKQRHKKTLFNTVPVCVVPQCDYELLKAARLSVSLGHPFVIHVPFNEEQAFFNAKILHDFYGITEQEILQITGFWVSEKQQ